MSPAPEPEPEKPSTEPQPEPEPGLDAEEESGPSMGDRQELIQQFIAVFGGNDGHARGKLEAQLHTQLSSCL